MDFIIERLSNLEEKSANQLVALWERSVRQTHLFLSEEDIRTIKEQVYDSLFIMDNLITIRNNTQNPVAFLGEKDGKIEMLFVEPDFMGKGMGKLLINHALEVLGTKYVDVNTDNTEALGFYEHMGFKVFGRSEHDELGNPFPITHMSK